MIQSRLKGFVIAAEKIDGATLNLRNIYLYDNILCHIKVKVVG